MSEWQPIETAPRDGQLVVLFVPHAEPSVSVGSCDPDESDAKQWMFIEFDLMASYYTPTHWMPLPTPPAPKGD